MMFCIDFIEHNFCFTFYCENTYLKVVSTQRMAKTRLNPWTSPVFNEPTQRKCRFKYKLIGFHSN